MLKKNETLHVSHILDLYYQSQDKKLLNYMTDNWHLLAAANFSISFKLNEEISIFAFDYEKINNTNFSKDFIVYYQKKYLEFVKIYSEVYTKYSLKYPEILIPLKNTLPEFTQDILNDTLYNLTLEKK